MKKTIMVFLLSVLILSGYTFPQDQNSQKKAQSKTTAAKKPSSAPVYQTGSKRDPFRNLLAGREVEDVPQITGIPDIFIDEAVLIGIVQMKGKLKAIISGPLGFPHEIKVGDKFADGFVLSIEESQVTFRKTKERDLPLYRPKDVIKEINVRGAIS